MIRNYKALGLALVAVLAFSATTASGASAQGKLTAAEPVTLVAHETGGTASNFLAAFGNKVHCSGSTITGHKITTTPHGFIPSGATEVTLTPHYKNCITTQGENKIPTTVHMNGCDFKGKIGGTTSGATPESYGLDVQIVCPPNTHIQLTQFSSSSHALRVCTITITNTPITSDGHVGNNKTPNPDQLWIAGKYTNIISHKSGLCGAGTDEAGVMTVDMEAKAFNEAGLQIDASISH